MQDKPNNYFYHLQPFQENILKAIIFVSQV